MNRLCHKATFIYKITQEKKKRTLNLYLSFERFSNVSIGIVVYDADVV